MQIVQLNRAIDDIYMQLVIGNAMSSLSWCSAWHARHHPEKRG